MKQRTIELHIEELLLYNLPYEQRRLIAATIEQELKRLLNERGLPPSLAKGGSIPDLRIDDFQVTQSDKAESIGVQIGQEVYSRLFGYNEGSQFAGERSRHPNGVPATFARKNLNDTQ